MCVCVCVKRLRRTTLPLNWVVGNTLLWQLLFAGPGAKSCFSLTLSLALFFSLFILARSASFYTFFSTFFPPPFVPLLAFYRFLARSSSPFTSAFPFSLPYLHRRSLLSFPPVIPPFCLRRGKKKQKEHQLSFFRLTVTFSRKLKS